MEKVDTILQDELTRLKERITVNFMQSGENASGRTIQSLRVEAQPYEGILYGRRAFSTTETGRRPGRVPYKFNAIIAQWAIDKGLYSEQDRELKSFSYFVAKKIKEEGTTLYRHGGRDDIYSKEIPKTIDNIQRRIMVGLSTEIDHINLNFAKDENN